MATFPGAPRWINPLVTGGTAAAVALTAALVLKLAIGRSQVYPTFLESHIYVCRPFFGARDFMAFPSATIAGIGALVVSTGIDSRVGRIAAAIVMIVFAVALLITASHWLSDILGGVYVRIVSGDLSARWVHGHDRLHRGVMHELAA